MQNFFFMDDDEEMKEFGQASGKIAAALSGNQIMKDRTKEHANDMKKI